MPLKLQQLYVGLLQVTSQHVLVDLGGKIRIVKKYKNSSLEANMSSKQLCLSTLESYNGPRLCSIVG